MIPGRRPADTRCVFSGLFVEGLLGAHGAAFENADPKRVSNFSLANFLESEVPVVAARYRANLRPVITTSIRPPANVYLERAPLPEPEPLPWPDPVQVTISGMGGAEASERIRPPFGLSWTTSPFDLLIGGANGALVGALVGGTDLLLDAVSQATKSALGGIADIVSAQRPQAEAAEALTLSDLGAADAEATEAAHRATQAAIDQARAAFDKEKRPDHFESGAGFTVAGAVVARALLGRPAQAVALGDTSWWRVENNEPTITLPWWTKPGREGWPICAPLPLLVELAGGQWVGAAALRRFVLTFTMGAAGAEAVIFRSMDAPYAPKTERVMAELRVQGLASHQAVDVVARLRAAKHADPMLGVLAAYLHDSMGDSANIARTAYFFAERHEAVPFDIALLGRFRAWRDPSGLTRIAIPAVSEQEGSRSLPPYMRMATPQIEAVVGGAFPWMRQGWMRLDPAGRDGLYLPGMSELGAHLAPAPFTTLDAASGSELARILFGGD